MSTTVGETSDFQWYFSQVKGPLEGEVVTDADLISCVQFNNDGSQLATGDRGGRVVMFHKEQENKRSKNKGQYTVYTTFHSHEPEFDYLKSQEIEEKINQIRWIQKTNAHQFLLTTNDKTVKLWRISERYKKAEGYNLKGEDGDFFGDVPTSIKSLRVPVVRPMDLMIEILPRRMFANAHTYTINSISVNSDQETFISADDLRINLWHMEITDQTFNIVDTKPANMENLSEVITTSEFHPQECNLFIYSSSKGTIRLCDMRQAALCDVHSKLFKESDDETTFFREITNSTSDVKFSYCGRYMVSRDYLSVKVWDTRMESKPLERFAVHEYVRPQLAKLYELDCIFDKFECCWSKSMSTIMTGTYNNFFRMYDLASRKEVTFEASRDVARPKTKLQPKNVFLSNRKTAKGKGEVSVESLDFNKKILHSAWHPQENIIAVAATNNLFIFEENDDESLKT